MRAEREGKIGPAPFRGHVGAGDDGVVDERLGTRTLPGVALCDLEQAARSVGCCDVTRNVLLISQHDAAACYTEKVYAGFGHVTQRLNHSDTRFAQGGKPAQARGESLRINRHCLPDSRPHRGGSLSKLSCSSPSIMVYAPRRVEPDHRGRSLGRRALAAGASIRRTPSGRWD